MHHWPEEWQGVARARLFTGGVAPAGYSAKVRWAFLERRARNRGGDDLLVLGRNLDGPGDIRDTFAAISYAGQNGALRTPRPSSSPHPACWRLTLMTGDVRGTVDLQAVAL